MLAAPFCGRKDKHTGAVDAFTEFWQAAYADFPEPPCGHPESITMCFDAVAQAKMEEEEDVMKVEDMTAVHEDVESPALENSPELATEHMVAEGEEAMESESDEALDLHVDAVLIDSLSSSLARHSIVIHHRDFLLADFKPPRLEHTSLLAPTF